MANNLSLRLSELKVVDPTTLLAKFTLNLNTSINISNIELISLTSGTPDPQILKVVVNKNTIKITTKPLTYLSNYVLTFKSTDLYPFTTPNAEYRLPEDGVANKTSFLGPIDNSNPLKQYFFEYLKNNIYENTDPNTLVSKFVDAVSKQFEKALYDIRQVKNENYLSVTITDELKKRGSGPFDRLNEEGAYQILRVGKTKTGSNVTSEINFDEFPTYAVTLGQETYTETLYPDTTDTIGKFNINTLTLNLTKSPVIKLKSLTITYLSVNPIYNYSIESLGYQLLSSKYDKDYAFTLLTLNNNQLKLNDAVLEDENFSLENIFKIDIEYYYNDLGKVVDKSTIEVYTLLDTSRETIPPIVNSFNLKHGSIVDSNGNTVETGGLSFIDPNKLQNQTGHPAFLYEIPFRLAALPSIPGQYSVDYATGTVYVYGELSLNDGTGPTPPLVSYNYKYTYKPEIDYVYDDQATDQESLNDIIALPKGALVNENGTISFKYEKVLIPNVDYVADIHKESLNERITNLLYSPNILRTKHSPITNVFRIYNETSGEVYNITRWTDDNVYFTYNTAPTIKEFINERVSFKLINNELLFVNSTIINNNLIRVFCIELQNTDIVSGTEDSLGSFTNTSATFSKQNIFVQEKWYNAYDSSEDNINYLTNIGDYIIDYEYGILYVAVSNTQDFNLGTISYKINNIVPTNPHIISVENIYSKLSQTANLNKTYKYLSFEDASITVKELLRSDEQYYSNDTSYPYQIYNKNIGYFSDLTFNPGVTYNIKSINGVFENEDYKNSKKPFNFALSSSYNGKSLITDTYSSSMLDTVKYDGYYYVLLNENVPYLSSNISYTFSIVRLSDSAELWDNSGVVVEGDTLRLNLSGTNSPSVGDLVYINYSFEINDLSKIIVDYNKGELYVDYTALTDEILVSYEYGDNHLDFREGSEISKNEEYYVSYKVGALRDSLIKNFGSLVNIDELTNFNVDFERERYRDAITAALTSFSKGPTVSAIKNVVNNISHIDPEIIESAFQSWSLGNDLLNKSTIKALTDVQFLPGKYGNGILLNDNAQAVTFPFVSNIKLEQGTLEFWTTPQWNGIDNDASLSFTVLKDGYAAPTNLIFIGSAEDHPTSNEFSLTKLSSNIKGTPSNNKDGLFIYYEKDSVGDFYRWYVNLVDGYTDGYSSLWTVTIDSNGSFYDVKSTVTPKPSNISTTTKNNKLTIKFQCGSLLDQTMTFISDIEHYLLDYGNEKDNRISLFKDISGYLNFKVLDKFGNSYLISNDVSNWISDQQHHIAISWKFNNPTNRDEMHLFVDGFEVPNIIKFGQKFHPNLTEKYRTVSSEEVVGLTTKDIVGSNDLTTTLGSSIVSSSLNFGSYNILVGDTIYIDDSSFDPSGYTILSINGNELTLNQSMPASLIAEGTYSVNKTTFLINTEIDLYPNIAISTMSSILENNDLSITLNSDIVTSTSVDFELNGIEPGYYIRIDDPNLELIYTILDVSGNTLSVDTELPLTASGLTFFIYSSTENEIKGTRALRPDYMIDGQSLTITNNIVKNDMILIRTLGLNNRKIKQKHYVWSDGYENVILTKLPPPISLSDVSIIKTILSRIVVGPTNSIISLGHFICNLTQFTQPIDQVYGRLLSINISGSGVDFTTPTIVSVTGLVNNILTTENVNFIDYLTISTTNYFQSVTSIQVDTVPINLSKAALAVEIKETSSITVGENDGYGAVIKYSYPTLTGSSLYGAGSYVYDDSKTFTGLLKNQYIYIQSPISVAGVYQITDVDVDRNYLIIDGALSSFTDGIYQTFVSTNQKTGFQNGFFVLEKENDPLQPYLLNSGYYEFEYYSYVSIIVEALNKNVYIGNNILLTRSGGCIIDEIKTYDIMLTDTRVGETVASNVRTITKDFNSVKQLKSDKNTLLLCHFDEYPFINEASVYKIPHNKQYLQTDFAINDNFNQSVIINKNPIILDNDGLLPTTKEGTIEFWFNNIYDSENDRNIRYYFDAYGAVTETVTSIDNTSVKVSGKASSVLSVKLHNNNTKDYFAGGRIEIDPHQAIVEESISLSNASVTTVKEILQVISVKIVGDFTGLDYFNNGLISQDKKTIYLGRVLPSNNLPLKITYKPIINTTTDKLNNQIIRLNNKLPTHNSLVDVTYIPSGMNGNRMSLYKDIDGYLTFHVIANNSAEYIVRTHELFSRDEWHRAKVTYKFNSLYKTDEIRLWLDGYERFDRLYGLDGYYSENPSILNNIYDGDGYSFGTIKFRDQIHQLYVGSDYNKNNIAFITLNNLRLSNVARPRYYLYNDSVDVNYNSNTEEVIPVTEDLYTTYLFDLTKEKELVDEFAKLKNKKTGLFNFKVNIFDGFDLVLTNDKVKSILEKLIKLLKPANSKVYIEYNNS